MVNFINSKHFIILRALGGLLFRNKFSIHWLRRFFATNNFLPPLPRGGGGIDFRRQKLTSPHHNQILH